MPSSQRSAGCWDSETSFSAVRVFPMTSHGECAALLQKSGSDLR